MARYRKIDPRIWNDAKFAALSDRAKLVFFMLLTHPNMTAIGAMRGNAPGLAAELGWEMEAFAEAFREVLAKGMAEHDERACLIALPKFIQYNPPESPNVVKAWVGALDLLPECNLKTRVVARAKEYAEGLKDGFSKALPEAFAKSMPIQEQEPEQEPEQEQKEKIMPSGDAGAAAPSSEAVILSAYHSILPGCQHISVLNDKRKKRIAAAIKLARRVCAEQGWPYAAESFWQAYFGECAKDAWMRGEVPNPNNPSWKQNLDVLIAEDRFAGVMDKAIASTRNGA